MSNRSASPTAEPIKADPGQTAAQDDEPNGHGHGQEPSSESTVVGPSASFSPEKVEPDPEGEEGVDERSGLTTGGENLADTEEAATLELERTEQQGDKTPDSKPQAGGVKKVLTSGVFGAGTPKPAPASTYRATTSTKPSARTSLAPVKRPSGLTSSTTSKPTASGTTTSRSPGMPGRLSQSTSSSTARLSASTARAPTKANGGGTGSVTNNADKREVSIDVPKATTPASRPAAASANGTRPTPTTATATARARPSLAPGIRPPPGAPTNRNTPRASTLSRSTSRPSASSAVRSRPQSVTSPTSSSSARARPSLAPATTTRTPTTRTGTTAPTASKPALKTSMAPPPSKAGTRATPTATPVGKREDAAREVAALKSKVEELEQKLVEHEEDAVRIQDLKKRLEEENTVFEARLRAVDQDKAEMESRHMDALETLRAGTHAEDASGAGEMPEEQRRGLQKEMDDQLDGLLIERTNLEAELASTKTLLETTRTALDSASSSLSSVQAEMGQLQSESKGLVVATEKAKAAQMTADQRVTALETEKTNIEAELAKALREGTSVTEDDGLKEKVMEFGKELAGTREGLEREVEGRRGDGESWTKEKAVLLAQLDSLKSDIQCREEALGKATGEVQRLEAQLTAIRQAHDELTATHADLLATSAAHPEALADLQSRLDKASSAQAVALEEAESDAQRRMNGLMEELASAKTSLEGMKARVGDLEARLKEAEGRAEEGGKVVQEREGRMKGLQEQCEFMEGERHRLQAEHDARYAAAFDDAKNVASSDYAAELACLRNSLRTTTSQMQEAHQSEITALTATHATTLSDLEAEHAKSLEALQSQVGTAHDGAEDGKKRVIEVEGLVTKMKAEVERLQDELEKEVQKGLKGVTEPEGKDGMVEEMKGLKKRCDDLTDELKGTKEVLEMNRSHFSQSLALAQTQHSGDLARAAEARANAIAEVKEGCEREMEVVREQVARLRTELDDERVANTSALARLTKTPPMSPPRDPDSPSMTKLHQAHNAKVTELEMTIKRLAGELNDVRAAVPGKTAIAVNEDETF